MPRHLGGVVPEPGSDPEHAPDHDIDRGTAPAAGAELWRSAPSAWRLTLPHTPAAVPMARALVRDVLKELDAVTDGDTAELLTSELVANAVEHTAGDQPIELAVELVPRGFQVEVHDTDPVPPGAMGPAGLPPHPLNERGRGLLLIRTLSAESGYRPTPHGKAVWFLLPPVR